MTAAKDCGVRVPAVHSLTTALGRPGMVMERIEGPDLLTLIGRRPWMVWWAGRMTGEVHAQLHEAGVSSRIPALRATLRERIRSSGPVPEQLAEFALEVLDGLPDGDRLCHGDFHPGNIMIAGETPVVIDWTNATRGDPAGDVARTLLLLRLGKPPPGTSAVLRLMALVGRTLLTSTYLRSYQRVRPVDMGLVERWEVAHAAARLGSERIEGETGALVRLLEERRRAA
jgi:Ser/Thr protein kinase RdoA (MazF antagonist)